MIAEAKVWIEGAIRSQRPNGDFGPARGGPKDRDFWGNMIMLYCLQSYYEYSGDERVLNLMERYFRFQLSVEDKYFLNSRWQKARGGDNLYSVLWLYNRTGDDWLLQLAEKIHRNTANWSSRGNSLDALLNKKSKRYDEWPDWYGDLIDWHNVDVAQAFREPAQYFQVSGDRRDLEASYEDFRIVREAFGQVPGGMFGADENARPGYDDPRQGIETCGLVEQLNSDEHLLRITGDPFWADHAEDVAFNMLPAAMMPDMRSLRYITAPNMVLSDAESHDPGTDNTGPILIMNPFSCRCCQHNHTQGWPYYAENLWMATPDDGLLAALYAASEVTAKVGAEGVPVTIVETSNYPFEEEVAFEITAGGGRFPVYLRVPGWCSNATLAINGEPSGVAPGAGKFLRIDREWKTGDRFVLSLPMSLRLHKWRRNHNSVSLSHGPLTYSLKIEEQYIRCDSGQTALRDSQWQKGADTKAWPAFEIHPASPWNYGLVLNDRPLEEQFQVTREPWPASDYPFTVNEVPAYIAATARRIPEWQLDQHGLCGELQDSPARSTQPNDRVELIPMGAARLRISAFPVVGEDDSANPWINTQKPEPK